MAEVATSEVEVVETKIGPNSPPQVASLSSPAHIIVDGGAAGGGKTFLGFLDPLRFTYGFDENGVYAPSVPGYTGVFFRRTSPEITNEGGLWDTSMKVYGPLSPYAEAVAGNLEWRFPWVMTDTGPKQCTIRMTHLQHAWTVRNWDGAQVPYFYFDQLEHFEESQFWYLLSRNRSDTGIPGRMRAGANPDPDSFLAELIAWWIDQREEVKIRGRIIPNPQWGFPIPSRAGRMRWFIRLDGQLVWANTRRELYSRLPRKLPGGIHPRHAVKSLAFFPFKAEDNPDLIRDDPGYIGSLLALDAVERARKLGGNWKIREQKGKVFPRGKVRILPARPTNIVKILRYWDKAASEDKGSDWSVGVLFALLDNSRYVVLDVVRGQWETGEREAVIRQVAELDGLGVPIVLEQEGGSGGKDSAFYTITQTVPGWDVQPDSPSGQLIARSRGLAAQWQAGNVDIVAGEWNADYLRELDGFDGKPSTYTKKDDQVAATTGAFNWQLTMQANFNPRAWATVRG